MISIRLFNSDCRNMGALPDESVRLVVTSPPYPMIAMWDGLFTGMDKGVSRCLEEGKGESAFEIMHRQLDPVWKECHRILSPGGFLCLNIGDAVRTLKGEFRLYSNHARILSSCLASGFTPLPAVIWRKPANSPTKFMGSGMLPAGAYVTLEHEYILILRKGGKREVLSEKERLRRRESAYFWEERNRWFSDVWTFAGISQRLPVQGSRERSAAFPLELAVRLISMYSLKGDLVVDPFLGTGTTLFAAMALGRHGAGFELDPSLCSDVLNTPLSADGFLSRVNEDRLEAHRRWAEEEVSRGREFRYRSRNYGFPVMTRQEEDILLYRPGEITRLPDGFSVREAHEDSSALDRPDISR